MASLFISYSRRDIEVARKLTEAFKSQNLDFWIDWEGIPPTVNWWREIEKGIEEADIFLFLLSPDSANSPVCQREIKHAAKNGKRLIPVVVRDPQADKSPSELSELNWILCRDRDDFNTALGNLITAVKTDYAWVQVQRQLQIKALEWERSNHENSFLLRGKELRDAEFQLATNTSKEPHATDLQREYVLRSRQATYQQRRITTSIAIAGVITLAALAIFGFVQAGLATANAKEAQNNAFTAQAVSTLAVGNAGTAQAASTLAFSNAETAVANEQEAKQQAQIVLARQLSAKAQIIHAVRNSKQMIAFLLAIQSLSMVPSSEAAQVLLNNNYAAHPIARMTHADDVWAVAFSPDGTYVASGSADDTAHVWEAATGQGIARMIHNDDALSVAFSPDGKYVVSGSLDNTARVWEVDDAASMWETATGQEVARMTHDDWIVSVAFSPDGKYVVSGSVDNTARVWEATTGQEVARMTHDEDVLSVAFSQDGKYVVSGSFGSSGSGDNTVRIWIWQPDDLIANACESLPRNLTRPEWKQYIGNALPYQPICPDLPTN